ncbi:protein YgfX [Pseudomonas sp. PS02288]|uniref:protein YgfX n=1 Tax=Pseudomonas sp. PS02288 TaxID=2991443 RepID=UPI00249B63FC|nr:protein YgfX [Pseudomonas sp. PS02288]
MSSPSDRFECHWRPSRLLLAFYLFAAVLASIAVIVADIPWPFRLLGFVLCLAHAAWYLPRNVLLSAEAAFRGLQYDEDGWRLWSPGAGWQPVQLRPDSLALPSIVVLRFRFPGLRRVRSLCIPRDALSRVEHRRLRVCLKFSRRRWAAAE